MARASGASGGRTAVKWRRWPRAGFEPHTAREGGRSSYPIIADVDELPLSRADGPGSSMMMSGVPPLPLCFISGLPTIP